MLCVSLKAMSENGCENDIFQNRVSIWTIERHASTTNFQEYPGGQKGQHFCWGVDSLSGYNLPRINRALKQAGQYCRQ